MLFTALFKIIDLQSVAKLPNTFFDISCKVVALSNFLSSQSSDIYPCCIVSSLSHIRHFVLFILY